MDRSHIIRGQNPGLKQEEALRQRAHMTPAEALLWEKLRANQIDGCHFRRQQVIDGFIVDFYCHRAGLVIEVDGASHVGREDHDVERDSILKCRGLRILRISNDKVETELETVIGMIRSELAPCRKADR